MKKKLCAAAVFLALGILLVPATAFAADYDIWVNGGNDSGGAGGVRVTDSNKSNVLGGGTVSFDPSTNVLTLNGYSGREIESHIPITIALADGSNNSITCADPTAAIGAALPEATASNNFFVITGAGNLTVKNTAGSGIAVNYGSLGIDMSGNLDISSSDGQAGIWAISGYVSINGSGNVSVDSHSNYGIRAGSSVSISGSGSLSVQTYGGEGIYAGSNGVNVSGSKSVTVNTPGSFAVLMDGVNGNGHPYSLALWGTGSPVSFTARQQAVYNSAVPGDSVINLPTKTGYVLASGNPAGNSVKYEYYWNITAKNCTAKVDGSAATKAKAGQTVSVTATDIPEGKVVKRWDVSPNVTLSATSGPTTSFTMPEGDVTISPYIDYPSEVQCTVGKQMRVPVYTMDNDGGCKEDRELEVEVAEGYALPEGLDLEIRYGIVYVTGTPKTACTFGVQFYTEEAFMQGGFYRTFVVAPQTLSSAKVSLGTTTYAYNGYYKKPAVTVKNAAGEKLVKDVDYTVTYSNNKSIGTAKAKVVGIGNYKGTITKSFTIKPAKTAIKSLTKGSKSFKVTWTPKKSAAAASGYQIRYSTKSSMASAKLVTVTKYSSKTKTIKKLKGHKKYYVQIRTYKTVNGVKKYSDWSAKKYVTTKY